MDRYFRDEFYWPKLSPYERGERDAKLGHGGPRYYPRGDASWKEKLYFRGYQDYQEQPREC